MIEFYTGVTNYVKQVGTNAGKNKGKWQKWHSKRNKVFIRNTDSHHKHKVQIDGGAEFRDMSAIFGFTEPIKWT